MEAKCRRSCRLCCLEDDVLCQRRLLRDPHQVALSAADPPPDDLDEPRAPASQA